VLPLIIAAAVGTIGFTGYKLVRECSCCLERFKWTHNCLCCDDVICGNCGTEMAVLNLDGKVVRAAGVTCPGSCTDKIKQQDKENIEKDDAKQEKRRLRLERISKVRLVSVNFGGVQKPKHGQSLETGWHSEKHYAEEAARRIAVDDYDVDTVWYVKTISESFPGTSPNGRPYHYRQWKVSGEV
jgi:hypothetical protein